MRHRSTIPLFEALESRQMLSDLAGSLQDVFLPPSIITGASAKGSVIVEVTNSGDLLAKSDKVKVQLVLRSTDEGSGDIVISKQKSIKASKLNLGPQDVKIKASIPKGLAAGSYKLAAVVDPDNLIAETNESNNRTSTEETAITFSDPLVDLSILELSHTFGTQLTPGETGTATLRIKNTGNMKARGFITFHMNVFDDENGYHLAHVTDWEGRVSLNPGEEQTLLIPCEIDGGRLTDTVGRMTAVLYSYLNTPDNSGDLDPYDFPNTFVVKAPPRDESLLNYTLGNSFTFTRTGFGSYHGTNRVVHELGIVTDEYGRQGSFHYIAGGYLSTASLILEFSALPGDYLSEIVETADLNFKRKSATTVDGRTLTVTRNSGGSGGEYVRDFFMQPPFKGVPYTTQLFFKLD